MHLRDNATIELSQEQRTELEKVARSRRTTQAVAQRAHEGVPGSASGTAVRHVRVTLITQPYGPAAKRFELPSLLASCLALTRIDGGIGFYRVSYRWQKTAPAPEGVTFEAFALKGDAFLPLQQVVTATFVESDNVYRFTVR